MFVLSEVRAIYSELNGLSMHIVREEHWAANLSHAPWWKFQFWTNILKSLMRKELIVVECLSIKRGVHYLLSMLSRYGCLS